MLLQPCRIRVELSWQWNNLSEISSRIILIIILLKCKSIYGIGRRGVIFSRNSGYQIKFFTGQLTCWYAERDQCHAFIDIYTSSRKPAMVAWSETTVSRRVTSETLPASEALWIRRLATHQQPLLEAAFRLKINFTRRYTILHGALFGHVHIKVDLPVNVGRTTVNHLLCQ